MERLDLPFSKFSTTREGSNATSLAWDLDLSLGEDHPVKFFAFIVFQDGPIDNPRICQELSERMIDSIRYQQGLLEGNRISITPEDFFEQCLQKINSEIAQFLKDIPAPLPVHSWSTTIGMLSKPAGQKRLEFFTSRFGKLTGWLHNNAQLETTKLISIYDVPDLLPAHQIPQKFFKNILSSELPQKDQLFFCTPNLLNYISLSEIKNVLSTLSVSACAKQFENQINFQQNDQIVAGVLIKLSEHTIVTQPKLFQQAVSVEDSMKNLQSTESETQKLLGSQNLAPLASLGAIWTGIKESFGRYSSTTESELIPSASRPKNEGVIIKIVKSTVQGGSLVISRTVSMIQKRGDSQPRKKSAMELLNTNQELTKSGTWQYRFQLITTPLKRIWSWVLQSNLLKQPIFYAVLVLGIVGGAGLHVFRSSVKEQEIVRADLITALDKVQSNIDLIDSHLIVGRESEAIMLLQASLETLSNIESEEAEFSDRKADLESELEERQRKLRKEVLVTAPDIVSTDLSSKLASPAQQLEITNGSVIVLPSAVGNALRVENGVEEVLAMNTDLQSFDGFIPFDRNRLLIISDRLVNDFTFGSPESTSLVSNAPANLSSAGIYNNRLYSLSPETNQIQRSNGGSFSVFTNWITQEGQDLSQAKDLVIDGSIYVLKPDSITQYLSGRLANPGINLAPIEPAMTSAFKLWGSADSNNLFILESNRVLHFKKTGEFVAQYVIEGRENYQDVAYNVASNEVYVLTENELLKFTP